MINITELYSWIEKGKVYQTSGNYAQGWNNSIDSILEHINKLVTKEENIAKLNR